MKWNIQKRLLVLVLAAGILSFLAVSGLSFYGMSIMRDEMNELGEKVGKAGADFTETLMTYQIKRTLADLAKARAEFIEHETDLIRQDVTLLATAMTRISSHPENYASVKLRDPRKDVIRSFDPYVIYSPESYLNGETPETLPPALLQEIALSGNIRTVLKSLAKSFEGYKSSFYVGSKDGYFIGIDINPDTEIVNLNEKEIYNFDCRQRPWYKNAIAAQGLVFTDHYANSDNATDYKLIGCSAPYYDATGAVAGVVGLDVSNVDIFALIDETAIGENGFSFVLNQKGEVILSSHTKGELSAIANSGDLRLNSSRRGLANAAQKMVEGKSGTMSVVIDDKEYFLAYAPMKRIGWSFATLTLRSEIDAAADDGKNYFLAQIEDFRKRLQNEIFILTLAGLILLGGLSYIFLTSSRELSARFVKPINELSDGVRDIASGNLDKNLDLKTGDEIEHLATSFNAMTAELKTYMTNLTKVTAERERLATELDVAKDIQNGMLPKNFPARADFELLATMTPAKEVGGDFYDFYFLDETHLAITVADVSGKGIPAALFMVIAKTVLNNFAVSKHNSDGLAEVVAAANDELCANNEAMMFVTAFIGVLDLKTGEFVYINAGHNPPVVYRAEENYCEFLDVKKNFVLGPMDGIPFVEQHTTFKRGDLIFLYTDGVTEALNVAEEEYLPDRLIAFMNSTDCRANLETLLKNIRGDVAEHVGEAEQSDDITMFALRYNGSRENEA